MLSAILYIKESFGKTFFLRHLILRVRVQHNIICYKNVSCFPYINIQIFDYPHYGVKGLFGR